MAAPNEAPNERLLDEHLAAENEHDLDRIMPTSASISTWSIERRLRG